MAAQQLTPAQQKQADRQAAQTAKRDARERFALAERLEAEYLRAMRSLTSHIDAMVRHMAATPDLLRDQLRSYGKAIEPWAQSVAAKMVQRVDAKNAGAWTKLGNSIGRELRKEINEAPTGAAMLEYMRENVSLITSLPLDAAQRVHDLTVEARITGRRANEVMADILQTGDVTLSRARLIARTEIARTAAGLTQARALHVGCTHYVWRTVGDGDVRKSHKEMNGRIISYAEMPVLSDGTSAHAGTIFNCRCYAEPVLLD